jgi:hypothetical protein
MREIATSDDHKIFQFVCHGEKRTIREDRLLLLMDQAIAGKLPGVSHALIPLSVIRRG